MCYKYFAFSMSNMVAEAKFVEMHVGNSPIVKAYTLCDGSGECVQLDEVDHEKDLGIWFTSDLKSSLRKAAASAMRVLSMIRRSFTNISKELFAFLYTTYVRPHLEYCVPIWSPYLVRNIEVLEKLQKRATKLIKGYKKLPYDQRLKSLGIYTLFCHHQCGDLIEVFKIKKWLLQHQPLAVFIPSDVTSTRGNCMKLFKPHTRLNTWSKLFTQRVITSWNSLPDEVITANSIGCFKSKLDKYWGQTGHEYEQRLTAYY